MHWTDRLIAPFSPERAVSRARARQVLAAYEAASPRRTRKNKGDNASGTHVAGAAETLRGQARHLDQNHDLAKAVLNTLVTRVIGKNGINVEPMPKKLDGSIDRELAKKISQLRKRWAKSPETTGELSLAMSEQLLGRTWFRDGEALIKDVMGNVPKYTHLGVVPYSIELLEPDYCPIELNDSGRNIRQGIQRNGWGRANYYYLLTSHPGDMTRLVTSADTKAVNADLIHHLKLIDRLHQNRGVSVFAAVMDRLNNLKDYEEAEQVAARIAAAMAFYIRKGMPEMYGDTALDNDTDTEGNRLFEISPGTVFDDLRPGEDVGTIQSNRPSGLLTPYRDAMQRAVAGGTWCSYSASSKNYNGTYSAQRQELVESWEDYQLLTGWFVHMVTRPVYERFLRMAVMSGKIELPDDIDMDSLYDADYFGPQMPWIDPQREANGNRITLGNMTKAPQQIIRSAGGNPDEVIDLWAQWQQQVRENEVTPPPGGPTEIIPDSPAD
ncbi:phage portal protein [Marinobacterium lutimaris]|uniref:Phage portal protein, lambda family n=1 Tax=Marinobacterium lutimaris TaxID=568106 RepID=A0A1H5XTL4_9GAMM|nr:phage portal protein [Marinobacterium lutimaris]SEG15061.1 phage portal protein, lambda family [Marinobacterium lutimaris]